MSEGDNTTELMSHWLIVLLFSLTCCGSLRSGGGRKCEIIPVPSLKGEFLRLVPVILDGYRREKCLGQMKVPREEKEFLSASVKKLRKVWAPTSCMTGEEEGRNDEFLRC